MELGIGVAVVLASLIAWVGQILSFFDPQTAAKFGVCEREGELDESMFIIETKAMGLTDTLLLWTLPLSALLMILDVRYWPVLALIGSGIYAYLSGVFMLNRVYLKKHGKLVGSPSSERTAYVFGFAWILSAAAMAVLAVREIYS